MPGSQQRFTVAVSPQSSASDTTPRRLRAAAAPTEEHASFAGVYFRTLDLQQAWLAIHPEHAALAKYKIKKKALDFLGKPQVQACLAELRSACLPADVVDYGEALRLCSEIARQSKDPKVTLAALQRLASMEGWDRKPRDSNSAHPQSSRVTISFIDPMVDACLPPHIAEEAARSDLDDDAEEER